MALKVVDAVDAMEGYRDQARRDLAAEQEAEIETRAALKEAEERQARHAELCRKHGLPETATPIEVSQAQHRAWAEHEKRVFDCYGVPHPARPVDPVNYELGSLEPVSTAEAEARRQRRLLRLPRA